MKKILLAAIFGLTIVFVSAQAQAAEIFVGTSDATGWDCYVLTDSIRHKDEHRMLITFATLKMIDSSGVAQYLNYTFFDLDGDFDGVEFSNDQGYRGMVTAQDTPIEWAMYTVCREY